MSNANGVLLVENHAVDSHTNLATQYGGTGTTTSPTSGQIPYSTSGTTYTPTALNTLDVKGSSYSADAPSSPVVGQIWVESDSTADSFDPNIIRRQSFTATAGQTAFTTSVSFIEGYEQVFFNGLLLLRTTDYTTSGGNTVTLGVAAALNDIVEVVTVTNLNSVNTYTQSEIDTALSAKLSTSTAASTYLTQANAATTYVPQSNYFVAGKNKIINGDFAINQRGFSSTTFSTATFNSYGFDRFSTNNNGDGTTTASLQTFTPGTAPVAGYEGKNFYRAVTAGFTNAASRSDIVQPIESVRTFANQTIVISFWAKAGSGSPKIGVELQQVFGTGGSPSSGVNTPVGAITIETNWQRYSISLPVPSIAGKTIGTDNNDFVYIRFWFNAGSDSATRASSIGIQNNTFDIWGVQVEAGSVATPFTTASGTIGGELALCQRYYWRDTSFQSSGGVQSAFDNNVWFSLQNFNAVPMRATPTAAIEGSPFIADFAANLRTITSVNVNTKYAVGFAYSSTKLTSNLSFGLNFSDAGRALSFSAEL